MIQPLKSFRSTTSSLFHDALRGSGLRNIFNPSFMYYESLFVVAFRAIPEHGAGQIRSYMLFQDFVDRSTEIMDLTEYFSKLGIQRAADPKLFRFGDELWMTFNTGWSKERNDIYISRILPEISRPLRCDFLERRRIEKNWAFYEWEGSLRALYSLNGPILQACDPPTQAQSSLTLEPIGNVQSDWCLDSYTIGTQLAFRENEAYLVAHKKFNFLGRRLYLGRLMKLEFCQSDIRVFPGKCYLVHSWGAMLGDRVKHNKNLISCSYFSGLDVDGPCARISYGVNDVSYGFSDIDLELLL